MGCGAIALLLALVLPKKVYLANPDTCSTARCPDRYREAVVTEDLNHRLAIDAGTDFEPHAPRTYH